ncbi:Solute carrier organic anion transporter family member 4A1 [Eumeta japonica]|uniref:Solute carrier organic anion transporter family member 4A1 n=1 Tax=Eumeta variegata TaxID=151549 RepID=A0A4C1TCX5_EUMVA|nr:Solute carrier organic anion transporter family member 4A1 [Eumeta japonica]
MSPPPCAGFTGPLITFVLSTNAIALVTELNHFQFDSKFNCSGQASAGMPLSVENSTVSIKTVDWPRGDPRRRPFQCMVVNGFVNVVITTIERRFGLRSMQTGIIAGGYDMASFACLAPVTYLGGRSRASKPRWLGGGVLLMGVGSLLFSLPHFVAPPYRAPAAPDELCRPNRTEVVRREFITAHFQGSVLKRLRLGVTYEKGVTLGNVTMSHRTRERPAECLASLSHSTMIGLPRAQRISA